MRSAFVVYSYTTLTNKQSEPLLARVSLKLLQQTCHLESNQTPFTPVLGQRDRFELPLWSQQDSNLHIKNYEFFAIICQPYDREALVFKHFQGVLPLRLGVTQIRAIVLTRIELVFLR